MIKLHFCNFFDIGEEIDLSIFNTFIFCKIELVIQGYFFKPKTDQETDYKLCPVQECSET